MNFLTADSIAASYDAIIIGAGFYGCVLAEHLSQQGLKVLICEQGVRAMERASAINQARIHTGFHYPRSFVTSLRSLHNRPRFLQEFGPAVVSDFQMLYAVAKRGTKVNAQRFHGMYQAMKAPIREATAAHRNLFDENLIEAVFCCDEDAFDYAILRELVFARLEKTDVSIAFSVEVSRMESASGALRVHLADGRTVEAARVFNVSYAQLNATLRRSGIALLPLKHELVEIALVEPPPQLTPIGVTVMDGAFFSTMPYPAAGAYSLTHVRYTPHFSWTDDPDGPSAYEVAASLPTKTRWRHMVSDSRRYMPILSDVKWKRSLFDVKTVLIKSEQDDSRPILLRHHDDMPGLWSVLGGKIDNVYDLLALVD